MGRLRRMWDTVFPKPKRLLLCATCGWPNPLGTMLCEKCESPSLDEITEDQATARKATMVCKDVRRFQRRVAAVAS